MIRLRGLAGHIVLISSATMACSGAEGAEGTGEEEARDKEDVAGATSLAAGDGVKRQLEPGPAAPPPRARDAMN